MGDAEARNWGKILPHTISIPTLREGCRLWGGDSGPEATPRHFASLEDCTLKGVSARDISKALVCGV